MHRSRRGKPGPLFVLAVALSAAASTGRAARADVRLAGVFADHMVLQRGTRVPVWGTADAGERVTVKFADRSAVATADPAGRWRADLEPLDASDKPAELTVAGKNAVTVSDVLVGDVWLASGQSNMQYALKGASDGAAALADADRPLIRLAIVGNQPRLEPADDRALTWKPCSADAAKGFSAVGYFFGRDLQDHLKVPVGIVESAVAGTPGQSWAPREAFAASPALKHYADEWAAARGTAAAPPADKASAGVPSSLYNGMIAPLAPMAIKGAVWYQGESNAGRADEYRALLPALITGWRARWGQGDFPFLIVQLPGFGRREKGPSYSDWAALREAQASALSLPNTGLAVTIDLVPARAILHPKNKRDVGARLALVARRVAYGEGMEVAGPTFKSMTVEGDRVRIGYDHAEGLKIAAPPEERKDAAPPAPATLTGFAVAGPDRTFVAADARIEGSSVLVWAPGVPRPAAVRYAWAQNPAVDLYNDANLPAAPFRTDDWQDAKPAASATAPAKKGAEE